MCPIFILLSVSNSLQLVWPSWMCWRSGVRSQKLASKCLIPLEVPLASLKQQEKRFKQAKTKYFLWNVSVKYFPLLVQAVRETALSRMALFGTTAAAPNLLVLLLRRSVTFKCPPLPTRPVPTSPGRLSLTDGDFSRGALCWSPPSVI